jgi:hypothetical protein
MHEYHHNPQRKSLGEQAPHTQNYGPESVPWPTAKLVPLAHGLKLVLPKFQIPFGWF